MTRLRLTTCTVSLDRREVVRADQVPRALTAVEARLLSAFASHPGADLSRDALAGYGWPGKVVDPRTVDSAIKRLRVKLDDAGSPRHLLSSYGLGYRFVVGPDAAPTEPDVAEPPQGAVVGLQTGILDLPRFRFHPRDGAPIVLSRAEIGLLELLARPAGRTVGRDEIIGALWGRGSHERALDALLRRLRTKLGEGVLLTVRGVGVRLDVVGPGGSVRTNLDPPRAPFVDRPELGFALEALRRHQRVTLVGAGGIGKTRLAHEIGRRWLDLHRSAHVRICDLSGAGSERTVLRQAALGIGLPPGCGDPEHRIGPALAGLPAGSLLVLDPFEHVLGCRAWVERWARQAPEIRILVTSREPLGGEPVVPVAPLPLDAGCRLFTERAGLAFDAGDVRTLVRRLDGLPLAIELAATRCDTFPPGVLAARMSEVLDVLVRRPAASESLHSTLRGAFDWSWDLLSPEERDAWAASSTFVGPFDAEAARAIGVRATLLESLARRSILAREGGGAFRMLDTARAYGAERLARTTLDAEDRHAAWCCAIADCGATWDGYGDDRAVHAAWDELWAVLGRTSDPAVRGRVGWALVQAAVREGWGALAEEIAALAVERGVDDRHRAVLLARLGSEAVRVGRHADADALLARAEGALQPGDERARAIVAWARARLDDVSGRSLAAVESARREVIRLDGADPARRAHALVSFGAIAMRGWEGDVDLREQAVEAARQAGDPRLLSSALRQWAARAAPAAALAALDEAYALAERGSWAFGQALALRGRMQRESEAGQLLAALSREAPIAALDVDPHSDLASSTRLCAAFACVDLGRTSEAWARLRAPPRDAMNRQAWEQARLLLDRLEGRPRLPSVPADAGPGTLDGAAGAAAELGRLAEARTWLAAAEARTRSAGPHHRERFERCHALTGALLALAEGGPTAAAREVLAAGRLVACDDGVARERPVIVSVRRTLLERALTLQVK